MSQLLRILGIDPGLNTTGYGVLDITSGSIALVEAGVVSSKPSGQLQDRLASIHEGISDVMNSLKPHVIAMEELYSHYDRPKTAILMGHARGVLCLAASQHETPLYHYAATQIKKMLTGNGRAAKAQVQLAVTRHLNLQQVPEPPDVADALAIALCHHYLSKRPASLI